MAQNLTEKIVQQFCVDNQSLIYSGDYVFISPKHIMTHDNTSAVIEKFITFGCPIYNNKQIVFTLDHDIQNKTPGNLLKYKTIEKFSQNYQIDFYPAGRGIGHQVMCEEGYVWPHTLVVASDSHSNMYGGLGCLGTPITRTDAAAIWATGKTWWQVPAVAQINLKGKLQQGVTGKDIIVALCGYFSHDEVLNSAVEFTGEGVSHLSIEERLSIANMTTEWGALSALFPVDNILLEWFRKRFENHPRKSSINILQADQGAQYSKILDIDISSVSPCISGPNSVKKMSYLSEIRKQKIKIDKAYLVSCVNSRASDIASAANILEGKKIASHVKFYLAAASSQVQQESEKSGDWQKLIDAGAIVLPPGCGPCIGLGEGILEDNEVGISATNRNFRGRMGSRQADVYLASPSVVAYSAWKGYIDYCGEWQQNLSANCTERKTSLNASSINLMAGFPKEITSHAIFCPQNNINTDGIYPGKYTYDESVTQEKQALVAMENYDPQFQKIVQENDILIAGFNFGTGSSREQAATALKYKKIQAIVAGSFSDTYKRNALNNGLLVIECSQLVSYLQKQYNQLSVRLPEKISIHFIDATIRYGENSFAFVPLGEVAQQLILSDGLYCWIQKKFTVSG